MSNYRVQMITPDCAVCGYPITTERCIVVEPTDEMHSCICDKCYTKQKQMFFDPWMREVWEDYMDEMRTETPTREREIWTA